MPRMTFAEALIDGLVWALRSDPNAVILGRGLTGHGAEADAQKPLMDEFGDRITDPPTSEQAMTSLGIGAAIAGTPMLVHYGTASFALEAWNQFVNEAGNAHYMSGGQLEVPVVFHVFHGIRGGGGPQHSVSPHAMMANAPGIEIVMPASPMDAKGLMRAAMKSRNPTFFFNHTMLLGLEEDVPEGDFEIPLGKAAVKRRGRDVTVVALSKMVPEALSAAETLAKDGIDVEVVDLRTLCPLDENTVLDSVKKTGRLVVADEGSIVCGAASEVAAFVAEKAFASLKAPVARVARAMVPVPFSPPLEAAVMPGAQQIVDACLKCVKTRQPIAG
ncbi:MAG: alpha-ketoacid dehydrogenase subunit beta [Gemmatimonas sp.]